MRIVRVIILVFIIAAFIGAFWFLCQHFRPEIYAVLRSLRLYGLILAPVFFVIGVFLFLEDKWSILSSLSFLCLLVMAVSTYGYLLAIFTPSTSSAYNENADPEARLIRIFMAEFTIILLMIAAVVKSYWEERRQSESLADSNTSSLEGEE